MRLSHQTKFHFDSTQDSKEISISVTCITQQCLYDVTYWEIQISREQNIIFSSNRKKIINYTSKATLRQKVVLQHREPLRMILIRWSSSGSSFVRKSFKRKALSSVCIIPRKFNVKRNNNKVDSTETERIVIAHLLP